MKTKATQEGLFVYLDNPIVKGWHKCNTEEFKAYCDPASEDVKSGLSWTAAPLDEALMTKALALIHAFPVTEVMLALYYNTEDRTWMVHIPKQRGSGTSVSYAQDESFTPPTGYVFLGTIHSHPNMSAFWSGTDRNDQKTKSGLHVVVGTSNGILKTYLATIWLNGEEYDGSDWVEIPDNFENPGEPPKEWYDVVRAQSYVAPVTKYTYTPGKYTPTTHYTGMQDYSYSSYWRDSGRFDDNYDYDYSYGWSRKDRRKAYTEDLDDSVDDTVYSVLWDQEKDSTVRAEKHLMYELIKLHRPELLDDWLDYNIADGAEIPEPIDDLDQDAELLEDVGPFQEKVAK